MLNGLIYRLLYCIVCLNCVHLVNYPQRTFSKN